MGRDPMRLSILLFVCLVGCGGEKTDSPRTDAARFTGSKSCRGCHERFYKLWASSHHGLAMQPCTAKLARAKLAPQAEDIVIGDCRYRAVIDSGKGFVREVGPGGEKKYEMVHALGGKNVYYFLTPLDRGHLQVLPVAYDVRRKEWYDTTASAARHFEDVENEVIHWRERQLTFNTSCYSCHVSQLSTRYDLGTDTYHTVWGEPGINCETCHDSAADHVRVCEHAGEGKVPEDLKIIRWGKGFTREQKNDGCAPCHAKMSPITASFKPGDRFFDHYDLTTLEDRDFHPDGRDLGENYTVTLWRLNPCAKSGALDCIHCHTSSGRFRFKDDVNRSCMPCHEIHVENPVAHTHHPAGKPGSRCIDCHMPMTEFARMRRCDHSMLPPTPAATLAFKSPNACNLCHADAKNGEKKDAAWADRWVRTWRTRDYQAPVLHRAGLIDAARKRNWDRLVEMLAYIARTDREEIFASSLLRLLRACRDDRIWPVFLEALKDSSPLVRACAAEALRGRGDPATVAALLRAVQDDCRLVRVRAAGALASFRPGDLEEPDRKHLARATAELKASLTTRGDDYASHYNLGNYYVDRGEHARAIASFETAVRLRPDHVASLVNASIVHNLVRNNEKAEQCLKRALEISPENAAANLNLGMLLGELKRLPEAEACFRAVLKAEPGSAAAAYNLGVIAGQDRNRLAEAIRLCETATRLRPREDRYAYTLAYYQNRLGAVQAAASTLEKMLARKTSSTSAYMLLGEIYEKQGKHDKALEVYRRAVKNPALTRQDLRYFSRKVREME